MHKHLRLTCYALLCLLVPIGVMAQTEHTYLDRALPGSWSEEGSDFQQTLPVEDNWWRNFKDPLLDSLIEVAVKQNYSVRMAMDRIAMAKANLRSAQGSYSPTLELSAGWTRQQSSGNINQVPKAITQYSSATVDMNWEVDVFGSIRNRVKAEKENFAASKEEYNAAMVSLCAQVASSYINMRELQQEVKVAQQNCRSQQTVVQITQKRYETGLVSKLDVAQAQSVYYSTKASLPMLEAGIIQYANSLAILLGLYPSDLQKIMETEASLPEYIEPVGVGLPANLLLRRPDVRAAERQVNALAASLGASKSDWWPKVFVKGSIGFASHDFDKLANQVLITLANDRPPGLAGPLVEAPTGFGPQIASLHLGFQQRARLGAVVHVFEQIGADVVERIQSAQVGAGDRSDQIPAAAETVFHHGIDGFRVGDAFVHDVERFAQYGELQAIAHESQ